MMKRKPAQWNRGNAQAFTLTELMVAILLVTVIFAFLFPTFREARERAKSAACLNNVRNYGTAMLTLIADQNGLPSWNNEAGELLRFSQWMKPYLPVPPRCPLSYASERTYSKDGTPSYGFNYVGNGNLCRFFRTLKGIPAPSSRVVMAAECYGYNGFNVAGHLNRTIWGNDNGGANPDDEGTARRPQYHGTKEKRGLHFIFIDGHAELIYPTANDWYNEPTYGNATNGGYFYDWTQFRRLSQGVLTAQ